MPEYKPADVVRVLEKLGFTKARQKGSHLHLKNNAGCLVTVPMHNKPLKTGTLRAILKQAGIAPETLHQLL